MQADQTGRIEVGIVRFANRFDSIVDVGYRAADGYAEDLAVRSVAAWEFCSRIGGY